MKSLLLKIRRQPPVVRCLGVVMLLHLILWTLIPALYYSVLPLDSLEAVAWGSGFSLGNAKHPPLTGWIAGLTASATCHADWPIYLLSQLCVVGGMACIYLLAREFFGREESALAALTPEYILYYNVTSPEFNVNMPMLLLWPAAALFFVRAYRRDLLRDWILLGAVSGLCILCKYYSALLFAAFGCFLLISKERRRLFLSAGPWIAAASCLVVILPHAMWALTGGLAMMEESTPIPRSLPSAKTTVTGAEPTASTAASPKPCPITASSTLRSPKAPSWRRRSAMRSAAAAPSPN